MDIFVFIFIYILYQIFYTLSMQKVYSIINLSNLRIYILFIIRRIMPIPQLSKKIHSPQDWKKNIVKSHSATSTSSIRESIKKSRELRGGGSLGDFRRNHSRIKRLKLGKYSRKTTGNLIFTLLVVFLAAAIFGLIYFAWLSRDLPNPDKLIDRDVPESTKIYDRTGETILYEVHGDEKRTIIKLEEIPDYIKWATITAEDRKFYEHSGFNLLSMFKGVIIDPLTGKPARGGSTLTQQLVKNAILTNERKISRKIKEFVLSYRIEQKFSKDEIFQLYLNEIPYGSTAYGVEAAARKYFGVSARDINLAQAAILASFPKAPTYYSPYGSHKEDLFARQEWILNGMKDLGYITEDELNKALDYNIQFKEPNTDITAPHFVMYVREILSEKYGQQVIEREGLKIYTTLDLYKQKIAEEVINDHGESNASGYNANNDALVSIDPKTGQILAMVGSRDYFNDEIDGQVNIATRLRQPGSSLKPIVYAAAFQKGYTPDTILYDVVTNFSAGGAKDYEPHNYDLKEHGPITIRTALAGSLNIPAVKTLYLTGVNNVTDLAQKMGYSSLNEPDRYGLSLVLGGGEVKLLDHTSAYGIFAREGEYNPPVAILKVEDRKGKTLEEYQENKEKNIMPAKIARLINDILSDNEARSYVFGAQNWLTLGSRPVAAKTGTTNDYRDAWTIGYTPSLVTGVWVGNNDNSEMKRGADGSKVAAPIWHDYMQRVLGDTPIEYFQKEEKVITGKAILDGIGAGEVKIKIDKISGLLATENTPPELIEEKTFRQPHSILYYCLKDDPRGEIPGENQTDPQFPIWEEAIKKWAEREKIKLDEIPINYDNVHKPEYAPTIEINSPSDNAVITEKTLRVDISSNAIMGIGRAEYYIDDHLIELVATYPYDLSSDISYLNNGNHKLTIKLCDTKENCSHKNTQFNLILDESERDTSLNFAWTSPGNNYTASIAEFPLPLKTLSYKPGAIKSVDFYYLKEGDSAPQLIATNNQITNNEVSGSWQEAPTAGYYYLYAEAKGWSGNFKKTDRIKIYVKE